MSCGRGYQMASVFLPWFSMSDSRIPSIKANGTVILGAFGVLVIRGLWNGENWVTESGIVLDEPWKWMPTPS